MTQAWQYGKIVDKELKDRIEAMQEVVNTAKALSKSLPIVPRCSAEKEVVEIPNHQWLGISNKALAVDRALATLDKEE